MTAVLQVSYQLSIASPQEEDYQQDRNWYTHQPQEKVTHLPFLHSHRRGVLVKPSAHAPRFGACLVSHNCLLYTSDAADE